MHFRHKNSKNSFFLNSAQIKFVYLPLINNNKKNSHGIYEFVLEFSSSLDNSNNWNVHPHGMYENIYD